MDQICEGLQLFDLLSVIKSYPAQFKPLFVYDEASKITSSELKSLFEINRLIDGSTWNKEEDVVKNWCQYLDDVEQNKISKCLYYQFKNFFQLPGCLLPI